MAMPRSTNDADFVVACSAPDLETVIRKLPSLIKPDPQARKELFTGTVRWILTVEESSFQIELFLLGSDSYHAEMFRRKCRQRIEMLGRQVWLPTAEDLIIQKVRWGRRKDLDDAVNILAVQGPSGLMRGGLSFCVSNPKACVEYVSAMSICRESGPDP